jgi:hypothetical protein
MHATSRGTQDTAPLELEDETDEEEEEANYTLTRSPHAPFQPRH